MQMFFRRPVAFAAFLAVMTALGAYYMESKIKLWLVILSAVLFSVLLVFACLQKGGKRLMEALICLLAVSVSLASSYAFFDVRYQSYCALSGKTVMVEGTVLERVSSSSFMSTFRVALDEIDDESVSVDAIIECEYQSAMQIGDRFCVRGVVRGFTKDELFDEEVFRLSDGCLLIVSCETRYDCEILDPDQKNLRVIASKINERLSHGLFERVGGEEGALATALLLGNKSLLSGTTKLAFQYAGVSHLLALSGLHVSIIIGFVEFLLRSLWIGRRGRAVVVPFIVLGYLTLTGFSPSTCRAVMMAIVMYVAFFVGDRYDSFTALMLMLFLTLTVTPYALLDLSLWMSYISAAAIVLVYPLILRSFDGWYRKRRPPILIYRVCRAFVSAIVIGIAANLALMLLNAFVFGTVSLASVLATMLLSIPITALLIFSLLSVLFPYVDLFSIVCSAIARLVFGVTEYFAGLEDVLLPLHDRWSIGVLIVMTFVIVALAVIRLRRFAYLLIPPALFLVAICMSLFVTHNIYAERQLTEIQTYYGDLRLYTQSGNAVLMNDVRGSVSKRYEIKQAAIAGRCTVIDDLVFCHYYNQAPFFVSSLSNSIYVGTLHLPCPVDAREEAIAARLAEEAAYYGIDVLFDADVWIADYDAENGT